ncbi:unnamed protein product [Acidithrix sp. C25]|nr:unnamed protein product [Acidithrix sp. C25]
MSHDIAAEDKDPLNPDFIITTRAQQAKLKERLHFREIARTR